ncbi:hippurate hydrolase [Lipingzhangella halophila]|uniref:Hippurate hydrolase n=1 Tax=Lipingzhangella halophila TaxID=1783352 RepID=A0A7W7RE26_9ACTN|nr:amidohydrolase [Lipingzhangella halophila]MBB4930292.1 hippurate hydrolase [Lipingzhangella halophila]
MNAATNAARVSDELRDDLHYLYQHLHRNPELSMREHRTAQLITERMDALGCETFTCGGTGVVAVLRNGEGPVVAFRADTDALPVAEETGVAYASTIRGTLRDGTEVPVMHACGHDMHVTSAIGTAALLAGARDEWAGTVVFLFQPGEETAEGARAMLDDGLWDRAPRPEVVYGQHVWPGRSGTVEVSTGPAMAMADSWKVTVRGRGGHGSRPETTIDPVVLAAHMVVRIQSVVSREVPASEAAVVTIGSFHAGLKENIIPSSAEFTVNVRNLDPDTRDATLAALRRVIAAEAQASGAPEPDIEELYTFPLLTNDAEETATVTAALEKALGPEPVTDRPAVMGSEDFGHLPDAIGVPGVYWFFGGMADEVIDGDDPVPTNHSPHFAPVIEPTLTTGVTAAYSVLVARLGSGNGAAATGR